MMTYLLTLLLAPLIAFGLCLHLGYAWCRLALPSALRPYRVMVTPLAGCALFLVIAAPLTTLTPLRPAEIASAMALLALVVNVWAYRRSPDDGPATRDREGLPHPASPVRIPQAMLHPTMFCALLALILFALAILPPLRWGVSAPIGSNWDAADFYVPLGRALQLRSQRDIGELPRNPLVRVFSVAPVSGRIHAFSYLHATASVGVEPLRSYAPLMALVLALQPLAAYPLARVGGLRHGAAALATTLLALAWLPLWVAYNSFSNHILGLPLLSIALASSIVALREDEGRALSSGALFTAALATAYYPAMTAYVALLGPAALYLIGKEARAHRHTAIIRRGLALGALAFLMSGAAQYYFFLREGFLGEILRTGSGYQVTRYVGLTDALGLEAVFDRVPSPGDPRLVATALAVALLLAATALVAGRVPLLVAMAGGAAIYQLFTEARAYHYGFYKGVTFEIVLYAMLLAAGAARLWDLAGRAPGFSRLRASLLARSILVAGVGLLVIANALTIWRMQQRYSAAGPQLWDASATEIAEVREHLTPEASALVVPSSHRGPTFNSLISYALLGHELFGQFSTGYSALDRQPRERAPDVALLPEEADPAAYGYAASEVRWAGAGMRLYGRNPGVQYHRAFGSSGRYPAIDAGETLVLHVGASAITLPGEAPPESASPRSARLAMAAASFEPAALDVAIGRQVERHNWQGGLAEITSATLAPSGTVEIHNAGAATVYLWWGELRDPGMPSGVIPRDDVFVQVTSAQASATRMTSEIQLHTQPLPQGWQKLTGLVVVAHTPGNQNDWREIGQWVFFPSGERPLHLDVDLAQLTASLSGAGRPADLFGSAQPEGDGSYRMTLLLANNARIVYATPLWSWRARDGAPLEIAADSVPFDVVALPRPATPVEAGSQDGAIRLRGYTMPRRRARPGEPIGFSLVWQSLRRIEGDLRAQVTLRGAEGRILAEQTLPPGAPEHGTARWQEGELAEQSFTLTLPLDAPSGAAVVTVALMRPDGSPLPFAEGVQAIQVTGVEIGP